MYFYAQLVPTLLFRFLLADNRTWGPRRHNHHSIDLDFIIIFVLDLRASERPISPETMQATCIPRGFILSHTLKLMMMKLQVIIQKVHIIGQFRTSRRGGA